MTARATRQISVIAACAMGALLALAGCTPSSNTSPPASETQSNTSTDSLLPPAEGKTKYPLTLTTPWGETVLTERPERIAVVGDGGDLDSVVALGVSPVVTPSEFARLPWLDPYADAGTQATLIDIWAKDDYPFEAIAAARPDLIVAHTATALSNVYEKLATIAPVQSSEAGIAPDSPSTDWRAITRDIGKALDLSDRADKAIAETDDYIAAAAKRHPEYAGRTIGFVVNYGPEHGIHLANIAGSKAEELATTLGFAPHPNAAAVGTENLSLENVGLVGAEMLLIHQRGNNAQAVETTRSWLEASPLYQQLDAVKRGAVAFTANDDSRAWSFPWALNQPALLNLRYIVDTLETTLAPIIAK